MAGRSPAEQARQDREKSKESPVRTLANMTPEEKAAVLAEVQSVDREVSKRRAEAAKRGKR